MPQIQLSGITGCSPYNIIVCDVTYSLCIMVYSSIILPPLISFVPPPPLDVAESIILEIQDSCGCSSFVVLECPDKAKLFQDSTIFLMMDGDVYLFQNQ